MTDFINLLVNNKLIALLITLFGTFYWLINRIRTELNEKKKEFMKDILVSEKSLLSVSNELQSKLNHSPNLYKEILTSVLTFLEKHLEPLKLFSSKAFDKHLTFSIIYSFLFFYLVWLFGGTGAIGKHELMPNENRLLITLFFIFEILVLYFLLTQITQIIIFLSKKLPFFSHLSNTWQVLIVVGVVVGLVVVVVGVIGGGLVVLGVVGGGLGVLGGGGLGGVVIGGVGVVGVLLNSINSTTILYLLFFLILPFINTIFDYLSMIVSRYFAQKILYEHTKKLHIFLDILADLIVAAILLVTLAFTLYYVVDATNVYLIKDPQLFIPIEHYKELLLSRNLFHPDVLWITLMFFSTLIPTLIHLFLFVYSLMAFILVKPHLHQIVSELKKLDLDNHHKKELIAYDLADYRLTGWLRWHNVMASFLAITFVVILGILLSQIDFTNFLK
ncbi:MAG: Unknown protein [uncultured Sulfurovum sp.]|uniref:Uncharacterized protein n=1 Tax=uncultured Sulfurovum sp. TaxID=269237 RepID=A0A6S6TL67_9BACT|nr:MAG: Unknown protein [uncultured Sulfurovum sp.]